MYIQRKKFPYKPGPDHNPDWDLTYWNDTDACWVDTKEEATGYHNKSRDRELLAGCAKANPGDEVTLVQA